MKMKIMLVSLFLVGIMILSGCTASTGPVVQKLKEPTKLKIGFIPISSCMALYFADAKGYFKDENIDPQLVSMQVGDQIVAAVGNGSIDVGFSATLAVLQAYDNGKDYLFIVPGAFLNENTQSVQSIVVSKKSGIQVPKNLEGKKIGMNGVGSIANLAFLVWADKNGVDASKVTVVAIPFPQVESAFDAGTLDAALMPEPYPALAVAGGKAIILDKEPYKPIGNNDMIGSFFAKKSWIDANPVLAAAYQRALNRANKYIMEHPEEIPVILPKYNRITPELAATTTSPAFKESISPKDVQVWIDAALKYGYIKKTMKTSDVVLAGIMK